MYQKKPNWLFNLSKLIQNGYSIALASFMSATLLYTLFYQFLPFSSYLTGLILTGIISLIISYPMGYLMTMYSNELKYKNDENKKNNEAKNHLISILGHDIKSPLNNIKRLLEMAGANQITDDELKMISKQLSIEVDNTLTLTNNLINWIKIQKNDFKPNIETISIRSVIEETIKLYTPMANNKSVKIILSCSADFVLTSDPEMLKIIFRNILSNAIKYSNSDDEISFTCTAENQFIQISIQDNGIGMDDELIKNIMGKGRMKSAIGTQKEVGTGIGLNLTKKIIDRLNGEFWLESALNKGTVFFVKLPLKHITKNTL